MVFSSDFRVSWFYRTVQYDLDKNEEQKILKK
jgi:hypothetical protein